MGRAFGRVDLSCFDSPGAGDRGGLLVGYRDAPSEVALSTTNAVAQRTAHPRGIKAPIFAYPSCATDLCSMVRGRAHYPCE